MPDKDDSWKRLQGVGARPAETEILDNNAIREVLRDVQQQNDSPVPAYLEEYMRWCGGRRLQFSADVRLPAPKPYGFIYVDTLYSLIEGDLANIQDAIKMYQFRIPNGFWPVGEDAGGNQICIDPVSNNVYFWDHETSEESVDTLFLLAANFLDFTLSIRSIE